MGLFKNQHTRRESGEFRWPFKPLDQGAQPRPRPNKRATLKISNPVLIESSKDISDCPEVPKSAPLTQQRTPRMSSHEKPHNFEPLFQDTYSYSYESPVEEQQLPFELSAASAARFHDYLQDLSSTAPSPDESEYEEEGDDITTSVIYDPQVATTISLASPGKPKMIDLSSASSFGSSRSASSSSSDVRTSGFLHSRSASEVSECNTPYTPASFFDSSEDSTPSEEVGNTLDTPLDKKEGVVCYTAELHKTESNTSTLQWEDIEVTS